ncbi:MAG: hypothetical protein ACJ8C4_00435 [Gemmataceae bacterium]
MNSKSWRTAFVPIMVCCGIGALILLAVTGYFDKPMGDAKPPGQPIGPGSHLQKTAVVPTLDTPMVDGQSAIWCASFQMAWDKLKEANTGRVEIRNAEAVTERLNRARVSETDLRAEDNFAAAGTVSKTFLASLKRDFTHRFPDIDPPELEIPENALAAFAFLSVKVPWRYEFHDNPVPLRFMYAGSSGTSVRSFGVLEKDSNKDAEGKTFRGQAAILLWEADEKDEANFAIDLCRHSTPYQVVLARIAKKATLADTLNDLNDRMQKKPRNDKIGDEDSLLVPCMDWRLEHEFKELEGNEKVVANGPMAGLWLASARQKIQFRLDRRGAEVASEATVFLLDGGPHQFHFDRPFLLYVKKRDAQQPFLVVWVENDELLQPWRK